MAFCIIHLVLTDLAGYGIDILDAHRPIGIIVGKSACLQPIDKVSLIHLGPLLVGFQPMALAASLFVNLILCLAGNTCQYEH